MGYIISIIQIRFKKRFRHNAFDLHWREELVRPLVWALVRPLVRVNSSVTY